MEYMYNIYDEEAKIFENGKVEFEDGTERKFDDSEKAVKALYRMGYRF